MHAACLAIIERSALVTTVFSVVGKQILHVRPDFRARVDTQDGSPPTIGNLVQLAAVYGRRRRGLLGPVDVGLRLCLRAVHHGEHENPDPERLTPVFVGNQFVLYRIEHSQVADAGRSTK